ncbi:MAG: SDR family oxidoreductase [Clostridia bacterium]|nr:SDR family oxidoreductase [Clostridia bacterium]
MKKAVVTGGTRGIGLAVSLALFKAGYTVFATYRKDEESANKARERGIFAQKVDCSNEKEVKAFFSAFQTLDILVNNAGVSLYRQLQDTTLSEWNDVIGSNLTSCFLCSKEGAKRMLKEGKGVIVNVASVWGERGGSCESAYSASKAGMIGFTKALASELGYSGVRVNAVSPGVVETSMNAHLTKEERASLEAEIPLGRVAFPEEIASAVLFLVENGYCNGTILSVNGGF